MASAVARPQQSPITNISQSGNVWSCADLIADDSTSGRSYVAMTIVTRGSSVTPMDANLPRTRTATGASPPRRPGPAFSPKARVVDDCPAMDDDRFERLYTEHAKPLFGFLLY